MGSPAPRRWMRILALAFGALLVLSACPADEEEPRAETPAPPVDEGEPEYGGEIVVGIEAETNSWLPGEGAFASPGVLVGQALYDPLLIQLPDGEVVPYLASSLEPNEELTEWTLTLREGVRFHDGTELTAEVIREIFDDYLTVDGANTAGALVDVEAFEPTGELTGVYLLTQANAAFPDLLTGAIGWPFSVESARELGPDAGSSPVGTGPFQFVRWSRDDELVLERNDDYWREGLPYLDRITFRPIPDEETRVQSLLAGDIDVFQTLRQSTIVSARRAGDAIKHHEFIANSSGGAIFNTERAPVDDVRVRQALAYALDQEVLVDILGGTGISPTRSQAFGPDSRWFSERVEEAWPTNDPERARELVEEYVNDPDRSDGRPVGSSIEVDFNTPPDPSLLEISQMYQALWEMVGIEMRLNQVDQATHIQNGLAGEFMINIWRMGADSDPYTYFRNAFGDPETQLLNFTNYTHPVIDENVEILRTELDFDVRYEAVEAIGMHLAEAVPNTYTGSTAILYGTVPELMGVASWTTPEGLEGGIIAQGEGTTLFTQAWLGG